LGIGDWELGIGNWEWVSFQRFTDDEDHERLELLARVSVAPDRVCKGKVLTMGNRRYQVISLDQNTSLRKTPGTRNGAIVIGELL